MRPVFRSIVLTGLLASAGLGTVFAQAPQMQTQPQGTPATQAAPAQGPHGDARGHAGRGDPARREAQMQKQFEVTKAKLRITAQQEGAWNSFTAAMRPPARDAAAPRPDRAEFAKLTTPQRIDRMRELRARHMAEADARGDAVKTFYATLNPAQQQTFDALPPPHFGKHDFGHGGPRDHGPRGGDRPGPRGGEGQPPTPR